MSRRIFCKALLVVAAIFGLFVFSGVLSAQASSDRAFERARDVQVRNTDWLMAIDDVEGTAIGYNQNDQLAVKVFTASLDVHGIPQELDGVPVQVIVTGKFYALPQPATALGQEEDEVDPTAWFERPVPIGVSTGHPDITAGTIGCRVKDEYDNVYALSNNHVYANCNNAEIYDDVWQPGRVDGGGVGDEIGTLFDYVPIDFTGVDNEVDAAIASTTTDEVDNATPLGGYGIPSSAILSPENTEELLDVPVQKYGRTTGLTKGIVSDVEAIVNVGYGDVDGDGDSDVARFVGQIMIVGERGEGRFSRGGDSGSLIVTNDEEGDYNPVGLLFAGGGRWTIANPINEVLDALDVTIDDTIDE